MCRQERGAEGLVVLQEEGEQCLAYGRTRAREASGTSKLEGADAVVGGLLSVSPVLTRKGAKGSQCS
jgi:hypothetical protein